MKKILMLIVSLHLIPEYYHAYVLAGDYLYKKEELCNREALLSAALTKVIATKKEEDHIRKQIENCKQKAG